MTPVRVLAGSYAASAVLVFLQTIVLRAIPYDAAYFDAAAFVVRLLFFAVDIGIFVGVLDLARRAPSAKSFDVVASAMMAFAIASGFLSLTRPTGLSTFVAVAAAMAETVTFATSILVALAFLALARDRGMRPPRAAAVVFAVAALAVLLLRFVRASSEDARSVGVAWMAWGFGVVQPAALAALAWPLVRAPRETTAAAAPLGGGYRGGSAPSADEPAKLRAEDVPPDPSTVGVLYAGLGGLRIYRGAFLGRAIATAALLPLFIVGMGLSRGQAGVAVFVPVTLANLITSSLMLVGILRQRALPTLRGGLAGALAIAALGLAALTDAVSVVAFVGWASGATRDPVAAVAFPLGFFVIAVAVALAAAVQASAGESLGQDALARASGWTQALVVVVLSAFVAAFFGGIEADHYSYGEGREGAGFLLMGFGLLAFVTSIVVVVVHLRGTGEALRILRSRLALAANVGSPPAS